MSIKLADSLVPMSNDFPAVEGSYIDVTINGATERLQDAIDNGDLAGGGSAIQVETMPIASEHPNEIVQYVGASGTYINGFFYQSTSDGEPTPTYSWVQKNVQPINATASDSSYDNTTSGLTATNVQDAIDEIHGGLGSASGKDYTDTVRPNSHDLVESGSVYSAINNALSTIYVPRGDLTCAELTSSLLIEANLGNVYQMSDSGVTSALFINGAGLTINVGDNVGIIKAGADTYLFNYMGNAFDLTDYQKKELPSGAMIEDVIPSNASASNKLVTKSETDLIVDLVGNIDLNDYYGNGKYIARNGTEYTVTNAPSDLPYPNNGFSLEVMSYGASDGNTDAFCTQMLTAYTADTVWIRTRYWGSDWFRWSSWQKLATTDNILDNNHDGAFMAGTVAWFKTGNLFAYPNAGGFYSSTFLMSDRDGAWTGILKIADDGAGSANATIVSLGASPRGGEEFYYDETSYCLYFCGTWDRITITQLTGKKVDLSITSTTQEEAKQNTKIVPINVATTTLPTLSGTCKGLGDSECYATFDVTFDSWDGSSPVIIGIAVDGAYVNSKALIMVNNSIETASDKKVCILYADGVNCLFRVFALAPSLYSNTIKVYVAFYTVDTNDYIFQVQQRDYIGAISNLNVTNDSSGMPVSSWFQAIAQPSAPLLTTDLTSTVTSGSNAPITSGGVYDILNNVNSITGSVVADTGAGTGTLTATLLLGAGLWLVSCDRGGYIDSTAMYMVKMPYNGNVDIVQMCASPGFNPTLSVDASTYTLIVQSLDFTRIVARKWAETH